jgi:hypothetical protein
MQTKTNYLEKFTNKINNFIPDLDFLYLVYEKANIEPAPACYEIEIPEIKNALSFYEYEKNDLTNKCLIDKIEADTFHYQLNDWFYNFIASPDYFNEILHEIIDIKDTNFYGICAEAQRRWRQRIYNAVREVLLEETKEIES